MASETEIASLLVRLSADIEQYNREFDRATRTADRQTAAINRHLARATTAFKGMGAEVARMALGFVGFGGAIATATTVLSKMVSEAAGAELANKRFAAQLTATGSASGKTVTQLNALADRLKATTLATEDQAKSAISQLLSFRSVAGDVFDETLTLAQDLSAAGFGGLAENAAKLGKALEDPERGFKALRSANIILTDAQEEAIKSMEKMGDRLGAQRALLDAVRERVGGAGGAERDSLTGAWHGLTEATADWFETLGKNSGLVSGFSTLMEGLTSRLNAMSAAMDGGAGELASLEKMLNDPRLVGRVTPEMEARASYLRGILKTQREAEAANQELAQQSAATAEQDRVYFDQVNKLGTALSDAREQWVKDEAERQEKLAEQKKRWAEQEAEDHRQTLLQMTNDEREFTADMYALRAKLTEDLTKEGKFDFVMPAQVEAGLDRYQEGVDEMKAIDDEFRRDSFDAFRDGIEELFDGNVRSFEDMADRMLGAWKKMAANMVARDLWSNMLAPGGKLEELLGASGMANLSYGVAGYSLGSSLGKARKGPGNEIGGAIGGVAGSYFGPAGTFIGSTIGSFLGGQFGARPSDQIEGVTRRFNPDGTISRTEQDLGPKKDSPENRAAANALDDAIMTFINGLKAFGLNPSGTWAYSVEAGGGNSLAPFQAQVNNSGTRGFQNAEDAFKWVADQLVATIGEVPERLQSLVDGFDGSNIEDFFNQLERYGNFNATLDGIKDQILQLTDPKTYELAMLDREFQAVRDEAVALGYDLANLPEIEQLYGIKRAEIVQRYAAEITDTTGDAFGDIADQAKRLAEATDDAWSRVEARVRSDLDLRMETLNAERAAIEDNLSAAQQLRESIHNAKLRFLTDPNLFRGSRGEQLNTLLARLDETAAKAKSGDRQAQADLTEIAMAAAEANQQFNASSAEGVRIQEHIMEILDSTESYASAQMHIQEMALKANQDSVTILQQILDSLSGSGPNARSAPGNQDFAGLVNAFVGTRNNFLNGGGTDAGFVGSDVYKGFESELMSMIANTTDVGYLLKDLTDARSQAAGSDPYAAASGRRVGAVEKRLGELGVTGFAAGGWTGNLAQVHSGELLYTGPPAHVFNAKESAGLMGGGGSVGALRDDLQLLARTVSETSMDESAGLRSIAGILSRMNGNLEQVLARV